MLVWSDLSVLEAALVRVMPPTFQLSRKSMSRQIAILTCV
jgi:hypothetical protein